MVCVQTKSGDLRIAAFLRLLNVVSGIGYKDRHRGLFLRAAGDGQGDRACERFVGAIPNRRI